MYFHSTHWVSETVYTRHWGQHEKCASVCIYMLEYFWKNTQGIIHWSFLWRGQEYKGESSWTLFIYLLQFVQCEWITNVDK
jgi:hypothetical protein